MHQPAAQNELPVESSPGDVPEGQDALVSPAQWPALPASPWPWRWGDRWLRSESRRRMAAVATSTAFFSFYTSGFEVALPLWVTRDLGYTASEFARLRSFRFAGVVAGAIVLGALSDRFGQKVVAILSMVGAAAVLAFAAGNEAALWIAMPVLGALVSTIYLNFNGMTQMVSTRRQGVANSIYRSVMAGAGVVAPIAVTALAGAWGSYPKTLFVLSGAMLVGAALACPYPESRPPAAFRGWREEWRSVVETYRAPLRRADLMWFVHLCQIWGALFIGFGGFAAIRFARELGTGDAAFGRLVSVAGLVSFAVTAGSAFLLDKVSVRDAFAWLCVLSSVASVVMGLTDSVAVSSVAFVVFTPLVGLSAVPMSMWIARAARPDAEDGCSLASAFAMHKLVTAVYAAAGMWLLGTLETRIGLRGVFLSTGVAGLLLGSAFFLLREPTRK